MANRLVSVTQSGTGGTGVVTYATLAAAIAGEVIANPNLVTMAGILTIQIEGTWSSTDTTTVNVTGFTTDSTHYVNIVTDSTNRASPSWSTSKYILSLSSTSYAITATNNYTRITGLQIQNTNSFSCGIGVSGNYCLVDSCFVKVPFAGIATLTINTFYCLNTIVLGTIWAFTQDGTYGAGNYAYYYNCVGISTSSEGSSDAFDMDAGVGLFVTKNCYGKKGPFSLVQDYTNYGVVSWTNTTSYSTDGSMSTIVAPYTTATFTNVTSGTENLSLPTGSSLIGTGTNLSADSIYPFNWDMNGNIRSTWDIGVFKYNVPVITVTVYYFTA